MQTIATMKSLKEATTIKPGNHYVIATGGDLGCYGMGDTSNFYEVVDSAQMEFLDEYNQVQFMVNASMPAGGEESMKYYKELMELMPQFKALFPDYTKFHARTSWNIIRL